MDIASNDADALTPLVIDDVGAVIWSDTADVIVVGFGGAGVVAALQAREDGADVLAIDRFDGGGATAYSGGVYYGGGTRFQREAGYEDTPEEMFKYLSVEAKGVVSDETMERFCRNNNRDLEWLMSHGVPYGSTLEMSKTAYPRDDKYLYFSGNERVGRYAEIARPAPRGHRALGKGFTGVVHYSALRNSAERLGVRILTHAPVSRLVVDKEGGIVGVEVSEVPPEALAEHRNLYTKVNPMVPFKAKQAEAAIADAAALEARTVRPRFIRARGGVILSTGGFAYNLKMLEKYRPFVARNYTSIMRLGSMGCDGSGIRLGQSAGGATDLMESTFLAKSLAPPNGLLYGIAVNQRGERFINEDAYTGFVGQAISEQPNGDAWLILNNAAVWKIFRAAFKPGDRSQFSYFILPTLLNLFLGGTRRARTAEALARKCGMEAAGLKQTLADYDRHAVSHTDPLGKNPDYIKPLGTGSYTAVRLSTSNHYGFTQLFTLGGLVVDERNGQVRGSDGQPIRGLYAAGRTAVGLCSRGYISGMSIADTVFSGRRAGEAVARTLNDRSTAS